MLDRSNSSFSTIQQKAVAEVLGAAFSRDPYMVYVFPNATKRRQKLTKLFFSVIRCCVLYGGVEVTPSGEGALAWLSGEYFPLRLSQIVRSGLIGAPLQIGLPAFGRLQAHEMVCEHELQKRTPNQFAYIWLLGVSPELTGHGFGRQVMQSALNTLQNHGYSACLLRTDNAKNVPFYEHLGFQQIYTDIVPASKLQYWILSQRLT